MPWNLPIESFYADDQHTEVRIDEERDLDATITFKEKEIIYHSINAYEWFYSVVRIIVLNWYHWDHK
jgi:hypothetical protein